MKGRPRGMRDRDGGLYVSVPPARGVKESPIERGPFPALPAFGLSDEEVADKARELMIEFREEQGRAGVPYRDDLLRLVMERMGEPELLIGPDCSPRQLALSWYENEYCRKPKVSGNALKRTLDIIDHIVAFLSEKAVTKATKITPSQVELYRNAFQDQGRQAATANAHLSVFRRIAAYGVRHGVLKRNPVEGIEGYGPLVDSTSKEVVLSAYVRITVALSVAHMIHREDLPALWLGRLCGLSVSEIYGLHVDDIDWTTGLCRVAYIGGRWRHVRDPRTGGLLLDAEGKAVTEEEFMRGKTGARFRIVVLPAVLLTLLSWYVDQFHREGNLGPFDPHARIMVGVRGSRTSTPTAARIKKALEELGEGVPGKSTHEMRASFVTDLMYIVDDDGHSFEDWLQSRAAGHAPKATGQLGWATPIYRHDQYRRDSSFDELMEKLPELPQLQAQFAIAKRFDEIVCKHTDTLIPPDPVDEFPRHLRSVKDAAVEFGISPPTLMRDIAAGNIQWTPVALKGNARAVIGISENLIRQRLSAHKASMSIAELATEWKKGHDEVERMLSKFEVELFELRPWRGRRVRKDALTSVYAEWARLADLRDRSATVDVTAKHILKVHQSVVWDLLDPTCPEPRLERDPETDDWGTVYITRESSANLLAHWSEVCDRVRARRSAPNPEETWIPWGEALGRVEPHKAGRAELRQLIAEGTFRSHHSRSGGVTVAESDVEAWILRGAPLPSILHAKPERLPKVQRKGVITYAQAPYGFTVDAEGNRVPDVEETGVIDRIRTLVAQRKPAAEIARILNDAKLTDRFGAPWTYSRVRDVVRSAGIMAEECCEWPGGCDRPLAKWAGPGTRIRFCSDPEYNGRAATRLRGQLNEAESESA